MGQKSKIQWTDDTDNVIVVKSGGWWCRMHSEGCVNCYAAQLNQNAFYGGNKLAYTGAAPELILRHEMLVRWSNQQRSRLHFVASMTDVFGEWVSREWQFKMLDAMAAAPKQIFQVLTKRPKIMLAAVEAWLVATGRHQVPKNIWLGCSVENQKWADIRLESMACLAGLGATTWVSYEPALGPVNWKGWGFIRQIISGGESGLGARPSHPDWHRATRDWCAQAGDVAYFFKQWGEWFPIDQMSDGVAELYHDFSRHGKPRPRDQHDKRPAARDAKSAVIQLDGRQEFSFPPGAMTCFRIGKVLAGGFLDGRTHEEFPAFDHPALKGRKKILTQ